MNHECRKCVEARMPMGRRHGWRFFVGYGLVLVGAIVFVIGLVLFGTGMVDATKENWAKQDAKEACLKDPGCDYARFSDRWEFEHPRGDTMVLGYGLFIVAILLAMLGGWVLNASGGVLS